MEKQISNNQPPPPGTSVKLEPNIESNKAQNRINDIFNYATNDMNKVKQEIETEEEEEEKYFCGVCNHTSYSLEAYQEHVVSEQHVNKAARVFHFDVSAKKQSKEDGKDKEIHHCDICDVNCNGDICWTAHLQGAKHKKKEKLKALEDEIARAARDRGVPKIAATSDSPNLLPMTLQDFLNHSEPLIGLEYITEIQIQGEVPYFHCELCDAKFDNNLKLPHIVGTKHRYQFIKKKDSDWARSIHASCERRSELTAKLADIARRLEEDEGRLISFIKVKQGTLYDRRDVKLEDEGLIPEDDSDEDNDNPDISHGRDGLLPLPSKGPYAQQEIPSLMALGDGILPIPDGIQPVVSGADENMYAPQRDLSMERPKDRSPSGDRRDRSHHCSRDRRDNRDRRRDRSTEKPRGRSPERRPFRERSPRSIEDDDGPKDISDEIRDEMKRQERRKEEKRRAEERKRRHAEREEIERKEEKKRRKRDGSSRSDSRVSSPPPEAPKILDDDTKRLVMQNLTELAKCCVTNEADAELALQVSNALTQALLQYRMKNMPASVLQTLNVVGQQAAQQSVVQPQYQQQQPFPLQQYQQQQPNFSPTPNAIPQQTTSMSLQLGTIPQQPAYTNPQYRGPATPGMTRENHIIPSPSGNSQMSRPQENAGYFNNSVQTPPGVQQNVSGMVQSYQTNPAPQNVMRPQNLYPQGSQTPQNQNMSAQANFQQIAQQKDVMPQQQMQQQYTQQQMRQFPPQQYGPSPQQYGSSSQQVPPQQQPPQHQQPLPQVQQQQQTPQQQQQQPTQQQHPPQQQQQRPLQQQQQRPLQQQLPTHQQQLPTHQQQLPTHQQQLPQQLQYSQQPQQVNQDQNNYAPYPVRYDGSPNRMSNQSNIHPLMGSNRAPNHQRNQPLMSPNRPQPLMNIENNIESKEQLHGLMEQSFTQPLRQPTSQMQQSPIQEFQRAPQQSMMQQQQQFQQQHQHQQQQQRKPMLQQLHERRSIKQEYDNDDHMTRQMSSQPMYERQQMGMR